jgi:hypothetical protein
MIKVGRDKNKAKLLNFLFGSGKLNKKRNDAKITNGPRKKSSRKNKKAKSGDSNQFSKKFRMHHAAKKKAKIKNKRLVIDLGFFLKPKNPIPAIETDMKEAMKIKALDIFF